MRIVIALKTDNVAFAEGDGWEVNRILTNAVGRIDGGERDGSLRDSNGNRVGDFKVTGK